MILGIKPLLRRLLEIVLGGLFFYAGYLKITRPEEFADALLAYRLLPLALVGAVVAVLPWLEAAAGLSLAVGLKRRSCLIILGLLTGIFLLVMFVTMGRGLKIDCGCGLFMGRTVGLGPILEDALILLGAAGLYYWELQVAGEGTARSAPTRTEAVS